MRRMSSRYTIDCPVIHLVHNPKKFWARVAGRGVRIASDHRRAIDVDWKRFNQSDYLFVHSTIVSSVDIAKNGYYINAPCDELVNSNGNAWSTQVLLATFRSFAGKNNYLEHVQIEALSKGTILDAVARPVRYVGKDGKSFSDVMYVDILVAVDRKHGDLVDKIESGQLSSMSMGCVVKYVQCSQCGRIFSDEEDPCSHIEKDLLTYFTDENGQRRITAELCGRCIEKDGKLVGDPDSVEFVEASWVGNPAFGGAVINHFVEDKTASKIIAMPTQRDLDMLFDNPMKMRVADRFGMMALRVLARKNKVAHIERVIENLSKFA